jgi:hypothetical protein
MIGMIRSSRKHDSSNIEYCLNRPFPDEDRLHRADITWPGLNCLDLHGLRNDCLDQGLDGETGVASTMLAIIDVAHGTRQGKGVHVRVDAFVHEGEGLRSVDN